MNNFTKPAIIIGHPGHELRAFKFIKDFRPDVFIITDGSGANNTSRINNTISIIKSLGAKYINLFEPFTDKIIYNLILQRNILEIQKIQKVIHDKCKFENYDFIMGDALEGFNPTHDLCRYLINSIVKSNLVKNRNHISNYAFDLDSAPNKLNTQTHPNHSFSLKLSHSELDLKIASAKNYPELKFEVDKALGIYGREAFGIEHFTKITNPDIISNWESTSPKYESYGRERITSGFYVEVIEFEKHMKPIALALLDV